MILLRCPHCHELRSEEELLHGGDATIVRPPVPMAATDEEWTDYLYLRANPKGVHEELWCCAAGCGQWFEIARHTVSHEICAIVPLAGNARR